MDSNTNILDRFEYINLPNFYINRYEILLVHSCTDEEDDFTGFIKDEFEDNILLQLVLVYINNSTVDINKNKKLPWLYDYLSKHDLLPPNGKLYPNFCIINIKIYLSIFINLSKIVSTLFSKTLSMLFTFKKTFSTKLFLSTSSILCLQNDFVIFCE